MNKPASASLPPQAWNQHADMMDQLPAAYREQQDLERIRELQRIQRDQIGELIGATYYIQDKYFGMSSSLSVSRYYPQRKVAIDIFKSLTDADKMEIAEKRIIFKKMGIRYGALTYDSDLAALLPQIGVS